MVMLLRKSFIYICVYLLVFCILFTSPVFADLDSTSASNSPDAVKVVRVFLPLQKGFAERDEKGNYSGYSYEYLMNIAQLTGWKYEFVAAAQTNENLQAGMDAVKDGELDLTGSIVYYPELEEDYLYAAVPYGATSYTLITLKDNQALNSRTVLDYPNLRVALVEDAKRQTQLFDDYCKEQGLRYQPIYAEDTKACRALVESGQADAMISKDVVFFTGYKNIVKFSSQPYYFIMSKGNEELMARLDWAMGIINSANPDLEDQLYRKYFASNSNYAMELTADELEYLKQAPPLRIAVYVNRTPIQDYDPETGEFSGIVVDVLKLLSKKSGLTFELRPVDDSEQANELLRDGAVDIIAGIPYSYGAMETLYQSNVLLTSPILSLPVVRANTLVAEAESEDLLIYADTGLFQGQEGVQYDESIQDILRLMDAGKYAEAYVDGYSAQHYLEQGNYANVALTLTPYGNYPICLGVARKSDLRLVSILEQAISTLAPSEIESIVYENTSRSRPVDMLDIIRRNPFPFILGGCSLFAAISVLLFLLFLKTRRLNLLISEEKRHFESVSQMDGLTQLYNHATFRSLAEQYLSDGAPAISGALLLLDIDRFKQINDNFGHLAGDGVLFDLSSALKNIFRSDDIIGRLGGDEFAVLLKNKQDRETVERCCERLLNQCRSLSGKFEITLSMGGVIFSGVEVFDELFKQADAALYEVKQRGRDGYEINIFKKLD